MCELKMKMQHLQKVNLFVMVFVSTVFSQIISSTTGLTNEAHVIQQLSDELDKLHDLTVSLDRRVTRLEEENGVLKRSIQLHEEVQSNLTETNIHLERELLELKQTSSPLVMSSLRNNLTGITGSLTSVQQSIAAFRDDLTYMHSENKVLQDMTSQVKNNVMSIQRSLNDSRTVVAFTAITTTTKESISDNEVIIFDKMITQIGNEYNSGTGVFTTKLDGFYVFFANIRSKKGTYLCSMDIVKNGHVVGLIWLSTYENMARDSAFVIVRLTAGDKVWMRQSLLGSVPHICELDSYNTFTGLLINIS